MIQFHHKILHPNICYRENGQVVGSIADGFLYPQVKIWLLKSFSHALLHSYLLSQE
ncbi:MAG: hypothetical protein ACRCT1_19515 [Microcoleaceae cyanobacterium]